MNFIESIVSYFVSATLISGLIIWLSKTLIENWLKQHGENYRQELDHRNNVEIERIKSEYTLLNEKQRLMLSGLYQKRAEVIETLHDKIADTMDNARETFMMWQPVGMPPQIDRFNTLVGNYNDLLLYFSKKRIYFSTSLVALIDQYIKEIKSAMIEFDVFVIRDQNENWNPEKAEAWKNVWGNISEKTVPRILEELQNEFREILGVEDTKS